MHTKFSADYWSHPQVEPAPPEIKLAGAWMRTNDRLTLFGYAEVTPSRFAFETGLPQETLARACEALSDWFEALPKGYFIRRHIREQIGTGDALLHNNVCKGLVRALLALDDSDVSALVLANYPELEYALKVSVSQKPLATPPGGVREEKRREEQRREEKRGGDRGVGEEEPAPVSPRGKKHRPKPGSTVPAEQPEPMASRMIAIGALKGRMNGTPWTAKEVEAFKTARLDTCSDADFAAMLQPLRTYYTAKISREMDYRRRDLFTLLNNLPGELDRARQWDRDHNDGISKP